MQTMQTATWTWNEMGTFAQEWVATVPPRMNETNAPERFVVVWDDGEGWRWTQMEGNVEVAESVDVFDNPRAAADAADEAWNG